MTGLTIRKHVNPPTKRVERQVKLASLTPGQHFRFVDSMSFDEVMAHPEKEAFLFQVLNTQPKETGRTSVKSVDGQFVGKKDDDRMVIVHEVVMSFKEAETVDVPQPGDDSERQ